MGTGSDAPTLAEVSPATQGVVIVLGTCVVATVILLVFSTVRWLFNSIPLQFTSIDEPGKKTKQKQKKAPPKKKTIAGATQQHHEPSTASDDDSGAATRQTPGVSLKTLKKTAKQKPTVPGQHVVDKASHHALFVATLKGHQDGVNGLSFSTDGLSLATACDDRVIRVYKMTEIASKNFSFKFKNLTSGLVDVAFCGTSGRVAALTKGTLDAASLVMFGSPTSNGKGGGGALEEKWRIGLVLHKQPGLCLHSSRTAHPVLLSCSTKTFLLAVDDNGKQLADIDTNGLQNHTAHVSPDGRLAAAATFTADVKVHEFRFDRAGNFQGSSKVMDLKAHKSQVMCLSFSPDSKRMVTASKDGTWRVWNIDVRYNLQEDPKCIRTEKLPLPSGKCFHLLSYGANNIVAAAEGPHIHLLNAATGAVIDTIEDAHDTAVSCLEWSPEPLELSGGEQSYVLATGSADRKVRLWKMPPTDK